MKLNNRAEDLTEKIEKLESSLKDSKKDLADLQAACQHNWGETVHHPSTEEWKYLTHPDPKKERSLAMSGHPPTGIKVGEKEHWTRTCKICGLTEKTAKIEEIKKTAPKW